MKKVLLLEVALAFCIIGTNGQRVGNHPIHMKTLFVADMKIGQLIRQLDSPETPDPKPSELYWYLESFHQVLRELRDEGVEFIKDENDEILHKISERRLVPNPIHCYALYRRLVDFLEPILVWLQENRIDSTDEVDNMFRNGKIIEVVSFFKNNLVWPVVTDVNEGMLGLARLQYIYRLCPMDLANGLVGDTKTFAKLFPDDVYRIALGRFDSNPPLVPTAFIIPEYALAIEWIEVATRMAENTWGSDDVYVKFLKDQHLEWRTKHDENFEYPMPGIGPSLHPNESYFINKIGSDLRVNGKYLRELERSVFSHRFGGNVEDEMYSRRDFFTLCRGDPVLYKDYPSETKLQCRLDTRGDPYLLLQPIRVEVLRTKPMEVYVFHNVVSDKEVESLKNLAVNSGKLERSQVFNASNPEVPIVSSDRTQSNTWLNEKNFEEIRPLTNYLDHVTGLQLSRQDWDPKYDSYIESEEYQVGVYGPGGLYLCHPDSLSIDSIKWQKDLFVGDRVATLMLYLSDVAGGRTAFPFIGVAASPVKGSAVFWYNLRRSGIEDINSYHGGCPVLYGVKWVSNKWIREGSQIFKRPCGQEPNQ